MTGLAFFDTEVDACISVRLLYWDLAIVFPDPSPFSSCRMALRYEEV